MERVFTSVFLTADFKDITKRIGLTKKQPAAEALPFFQMRIKRAGGKPSKKTKMRSKQSLIGEI